MKRAAYRWLINPLFLLATVASCGAVGISGGTSLCGPGVDTDGDQLSNDVECALGTDPENPDSDQDGIWDGTEYAYSKVCRAQDRNAQRRDPATGKASACTSDADCQAGETCRGLDPNH